MRIAIVFICVCLLEACAFNTNTIKVKGSDTEVNLSVLLAESFYQQNNRLLVSICGGGSGMGIASLLNGNADIANSSRRINEEELALFQQKNIQVDSFIFAQDAIAFVVSDHLQLDSVSVENLKALLSGSQANWSFLLKDDMPVNIYGRQSNSGTYEFIKKTLDIHFSPHAKQMNGNAQILEAIRADKSGIGYVGAGYVMEGKTRGLKVLKIYSGSETAISPLDAETIASGAYYFQRPLFQYFRKKDFARIKPFLDFEQTEQGRNIIHASGYYPVNNIQ